MNQQSELFAETREGISHHELVLTQRLGRNKAAWRDGLSQLRVVHLDQIHRWAVCAAPTLQSENHVVIMVGVNGEFICYQPAPWDVGRKIIDALELVLAGGGYIDLRTLAGEGVLAAAFAAVNVPQRVEDPREVKENPKP